MDKKKMPASKNFEDKTYDPTGYWLGQQFSSQFPLTDEELDLLSTGNWNVRDLYMLRYMQSNTDHMINKKYYKEHPPTPGELFKMLPPPTMADPKKYKDLYGYGDKTMPFWFPSKSLKKK